MHSPDIHIKPAPNLKVFWESKKNHDFNAHSAAMAVIRLSRKYIGKNVLDAGAGDGTLGKELQIWNTDSFYTAIDIAPANSYVIQGDITKLKYQDCTFDTIFCLDVLEHLAFQQTERAISEIRRVLRKDGYFIITSPYKEDLISNTLSCPFCQNEFHKSGHQQSIDLPFLENLLKDFTVIKTKICNLGFMQLFGFPADLFYRWGFERIFKHKLLTKDIFVVAQNK